MVLFDCCLFTYGPLVKRPLSQPRGVLVLFDVSVTTNNHVSPPVSSRPGVHQEMHGIVYACVAWLCHLIETSGPAGMPSASCFKGNTPAANAVWMGLLWTLDRRALETSSVVLFFC